MRSQSGFQPYRGPSWAGSVKATDGVGYQSHDSGEWNVYYLQLHGMEFSTNCERVPTIMKLLKEALPRGFHHAFISFLSPGTHIVPHYGPTNKKLRFHLPIDGVKGARMRVGTETRSLERGQGYVFDDSFEHEAWHDGDKTRSILIADFWHPDLDDGEVKMFGLLQNSKLRAEKKLVESHPDRDNFFAVIEDAKGLIQSSDWWK